MVGAGGPGEEVVDRCAGAVEPVVDVGLGECRQSAVASARFLQQLDDGLDLAPAPGQLSGTHRAGQVAQSAQVPPAGVLGDGPPLSRVGDGGQGFGQPGFEPGEQFVAGWEQAVVDEHRPHGAGLLLAADAVEVGVGAQSGVAQQFHDECAGECAALEGVDDLARGAQEPSVPQLPDARVVGGEVVGDHRTDHLVRAAAWAQLGDQPCHGAAAGAGAEGLGLPGVAQRAERASVEAAVDDPVLTTAGAGLDDRRGAGPAEEPVPVLGALVPQPDLAAAGAGLASGGALSAGGAGRAGPTAWAEVAADRAGVDARLLGALLADGLAGAAEPAGFVVAADGADVLLGLGPAGGAERAVGAAVGDEPVGAAAHALGVLLGELVRAVLTEPAPVREPPLQFRMVPAAVADVVVGDAVAAVAADPPVDAFGEPSCARAVPATSLRQLGPVGTQQVVEPREQHRPFRRVGEPRRGVCLKLEHQPDPLVPGGRQLLDRGLDHRRGDPTMRADHRHDAGRSTGLHLLPAAPAVVEPSRPRLQLCGLAAAGARSNDLLQVAGARSAGAPVRHHPGQHPRLPADHAARLLNRRRARFPQPDQQLPQCGRCLRGTGG